MLRREEALRPVHQQIEESIMAVNRSLAADLQMSLAESLERFGNLDTSLNASKVEMSVASAGAAAALASGGLALGATSLATTTSTIFFVIPVVTFSWPVFLVVGAAAASLAYLSPTLLKKAGRLSKDRHKNNLKKTIHYNLLAECDKVKSQSSWAHFRQEIDRARDIMLKGTA